MGQKRIARWIACAAAITFTACAEEATSPGAVPKGAEGAADVQGPVATSIFVVKPSAMNGWAFFDDQGTNAGSGAIVTGPGTPPAGSGSAELQVTGTTGGWALGRAMLPGTKFVDITKIEYSSYRQSPDAGNALAISLAFNFDHNVTDAISNYQGRLVFEPYHGNGNTIVEDTWQTWDGLETVTTGSWWRTSNAGVRNTPGYGSPNDCLQATPCTWDEITAKWPNAGIHPDSAIGAVVFKAGSGWVAFQGSVDNLTIGVNDADATYDFEPETPCTTTCYVNASTGNDAFGGDSPTSAKKTIQAAVTQVTAGGTVIVAGGTYPEQVTIPKALTLDGAGIDSTILQGAGTGNGIALTGGLTGVTLKELTVKEYFLGIQMPTGPLTNISVTDVRVTANASHGIWVQAFDITNVSFTRVNASGNDSSGARGLWIINGVKTNLSITDGKYNDNGLVGIDVSDGSVTGLTITGNEVTDNGDSGIGVFGAEGPDANLVSNNTVTNNGRFGIEIKNSTGNGNASGPGSVVVSNNKVSRTIAATDARDYAGIAVFRRFPTVPINADQPSGVVVTGDTVSGFARKPSLSTGDGFGIVVEGANHVVNMNVVSGNDVGIQIQAGNTINDQSTPYFDRGNANPSSALINQNSLASNGIDLREVGVGVDSVDATCNWFGSASGPASGKVVGNLTTVPWLQTPNLSGPCTNIPPSVSTNGPWSSAEGTAISFSATTSDPEGDSLTYDWDFGDGVHSTVASPSHAYADNGTYNVTLTVDDGTTSVISASQTATISNALPVPNGGADQTIIAGSTPSFTPSFTDAGLADGPWTYTVNWGDASSPTVRTTNSQGTKPALTHTYSTAGTRTRRLIVTDKDGGTAFDDAIITVVVNSPPVADINGPYTGNEGTAVSFSSAGSSDPDGGPITYVWRFGDGGSSTGANPTHVYTDNGVYQDTLIVKDNKGAKDTAYTTTTIANVAPTATFTAPSTITEGVTATLAMNSGTDKGAADRPTLLYSFDCGAGAGFTTPGSATSVVCPARPDNGPPLTVKGRIEDKDGGVKTYSKTMNVTNAAPVVSFGATSGTTFPVGGTLSVQGSFSDLGVVDNPWNYTITWGDGKPAATGTRSVQGTAITGSHQYTTTGTFLVKMTVKDKNNKVGTSTTITVNVTP